MAGNQYGNRGPPPPPPPMFNGPPNHQGQPRSEQQMPFRPAQAQNVRFVNNSARISDLTPELVLTDEYCRRKLTLYEAYTLRKCEPLNSLESREESRGDSRSSKNSKKSRTESPKSSWIRVDITEEHFDEADIKKKIKVLDKVKSVTERKKELRPNQAGQVTKLLDGKIVREFDGAFTWTLAQLERKEVSKSVGSRQTESITLYLKRAPRPQVNAITVFQNIERARMEQARPPPPQAPPPPPPPQFQVPVMDRQFEGNMPPGSSRTGSRPPPNSRERMAPKVEIVQHGSNGMARRGRSGDKPSPDIIDITAEFDDAKSPRKMSGMRGSSRRKGKQYDSDNSSADCSSASENDSEALYTDSDTTPSSTGTRRERRGSSRHRREDIGRRMHEKGSFAVEKSRRRSSTAYAPDPPRDHSRALSREQTALSSIGVSQGVAEGFAAGVLAAARAAVVDQAPLPPPRPILYDDRSTHSHRSSQDSHEDNIIRIQEDLRSRNEFHARNGSPNLRVRDDTSLHDEVRINGNLRAHEELRKLDELRAAQDEIRASGIRERALDEQRLRDGYRARNGFELRDDFVPRNSFGPRDDFGPRNGFGPRDDFGSRNGFRPRDGFGSRNDLRPHHTYMDGGPLRDEVDELYISRREGELPPFSRHDSFHHPRSRPPPFSPRAAMGVPLPLDKDRRYEYVRNPFTSRRRESMYQF